MKTVESKNKYKEVGFKELRANADAIIDNVKNGQSYIVKRKSQALFKIVPLEEEVWETVIDFTEIDPKGVPVAEVIGAIEELKKEQPQKYGRQVKKVSR